MALVSINEVSLSFGGPLLLDKINLQIESGERLGLLGRNGEGKTTLLKLIAGDFSPKSGDIARQQALRLGYLPQEVPLGISGTELDIITQGLEGVEGTKTAGEETWQRQMRVDQIISRMGLDLAATFDRLSAGMKRRVLLARSLVSNPDLLLLDEPTNHLDIDAITWMENFLPRWGGTLLFVTHDRTFLQKMATRIIELDRGRLFNWNCDYPTYLKRKEAVYTADQGQNEAFDKKLSQEEAWIRRGTEARRTRNEGRVRALQQLRDIRRDRREHPGKVHMQIQDARRSGRLVIETSKVQFAYGDRPILTDFSTTIQRGDKVGIIGSNGTGKTTLLRILLGELHPQQGKVRLGTNLDVAYYDQLRVQLDEEKSAYDNVGQGRDVIMINGKQRNLIGYLEDFLFTRDRAKVPIRILSGGERNRLLLARLFSLPANLLVLDEPTNDLDIDTLELLEDLLLDYRGTLLLVSHDRTFLNNLVTSTLVLDGTGPVREYVGGYDDWQRQKQVENTGQKVENEAKKPGKSGNTTALIAKEAQNPEITPRKRSYKEQRALEEQKHELAELPGLIESLEQEQHLLTLEMGSASFYQRDNAEIAQAANRLKQLEEELAMAFSRWEELERG